MSTGIKFGSSDTPASPKPNPAFRASDFMPPPAINERIGNLRIIEPIASGGMAFVYKVMHEELEVVRAIKLLKPGFTEETRQRLLTEAKISANLHHPNIVQIYNVALWKEEIPYIEMEYVHGTCLRDTIAHHTRLPFPVAASIAGIVSRSLDFARQQTFTVYGKSYYGLVHRDIKPANILISSTGAVKLADFGIALPGSVSLHTADSVIMGTSPYLSPEQIKGQRLDHRSDIYSLGTVLYEMLCGIKTFPQTLMPTLMNAKIEGTYEPIRTHLHNIPPGLADVLAKCLMVDKEKRYQDAAELSVALDRIVSGYTDKSPSCLVREYVESTSSEQTPAVVATVQARPSRRSFTIGIVAAFAAVVALMVGTIVVQTRISATKAALAAAVAEAKSSGVAPAPSAVATQPVDAMPLTPVVQSVSPARVQTPQSARTVAPDAPQSAVVASILRSGDAIPEHRPESASPRRSDADSTYALATNRSAVFDARPNATNRHAALLAWQAFQKVACAQLVADPRCPEASSIISALSQ